MVEVAPTALGLRAREEHGKPVFFQCRLIVSSHFERGAILGRSISDGKVLAFEFEREQVRLLHVGRRRGIVATLYALCEQPQGRHLVDKYPALRAFASEYAEAPAILAAMHVVAICIDRRCVHMAAVVANEVGNQQAQSLLTMKKAQAAVTAEKLLAGKGWVPEMMRTQLSQRQMAVEHPMGAIEG